MKPKDNIEEHRFRNLGKFQSIDTDEDWQKVRRKIGFQKKRRLSSYWNVAAAAILILGVGFLAQRYLAPSPEMISVLSGDQLKEVTLPDGSLVAMNKQAELVYPEKFNRRQRELKLIGEAFFTVVSNPASPFLLEVDQKALVRVLGTSFSIKPDQNNSSISVQVIEGKVAFSTVEGNNEIILEKDQQATLNEEGMIRDDTVDRNFLSWRTGKLFFHLDGIEDVIKQVQEHYGIEIVLHSSVPKDIFFTSTMDNQDLESVLDEIAMVLGLNYRYEDEKVIFTQQE
jgi:ferric-dicitrate binding protein FerR (iron transport regulator)